LAHPNLFFEAINAMEKLGKFFGSQLAHKIKIGAVGCGKDCVMSRVLNDLSLVGVDDGNGKSYEAYIGGRLGVNPFVGIKIADHLSEDACVNLVQNYFDLLAAEGKKGERAADVIRRLGLEEFKTKLTKDLGRNATLPAVHFFQQTGKGTSRYYGFENPGNLRRSYLGTGQEDRGYCRKIW